MQRGWEIYPISHSKTETESASRSRRPCPESRLLVLKEVSPFLLLRNRKKRTEKDKGG